MNRTLRWQAPELLDPDSNVYNGKPSDIYAFACVCYKVGCLITLTIPQYLSASQLFLGHAPFYEKADMVVILSILKGMRPVRPSDDLSKRRGLGDEIWSIIVTCWAQDLTERPTAKQVVECLRVLPNRRVDQRTFNNFRPHFPFYHTEHPFSALAATTHMQ